MLMCERFRASSAHRSRRSVIDAFVRRNANGTRRGCMQLTASASFGPLERFDEALEPTFSAYLAWRVLLEPAACAEGNAM